MDSPQRIGRYTIARELGRGGMGVVYEGVDAELDRRVAIKVLLQGGEQTPEDLARFEREARTAAKLDHESIVRVFDVGVERGHPFIVMEYVEGQDLHQALKLGAAQETALAALRDIAEALRAAHLAGIVHRDVKPENILIRADTGRGALLDFGVAKAHTGAQRLTQTGMMVGTPDYMAPEQLDGEASTASDVYALGATLYDILTGRPPFVASSMIALIAMITQDRIEPPSKHAPDVPPELEALTMACLEGSPDQRPTAGEVAAVLTRFLASDEAPASRKPWVLAGAVVGVLGLSAGLMTWALTRGDPEPVAAASGTASPRPTAPTPTRSAPLPQPTATQSSPAPSPTPSPARATRVLGELEWSPKGGPKGLEPNGKWARRRKGHIVRSIGARLSFRFVLAEAGIEWVQLRLRQNARRTKPERWSEVEVRVTSKDPQDGKDVLVKTIRVEKRNTSTMELTPFVRLSGANRIRVKLVGGPSAYVLSRIEVRYGSGPAPPYETWKK